MSQFLKIGLTDKNWKFSWIFQSRTRICRKFAILRTSLRQHEERGCQGKFARSEFSWSLIEYIPNFLVLLRVSVMFRICSPRLIKRMTVQFTSGKLFYTCGQWMKILITILRWSLLECHAFIYHESYQYFFSSKISHIQYNIWKYGQKYSGWTADKNF